MANPAEEIDVHEAITLRENDTLKTGDLFCCVEECHRLTPVKRETVASRHFRRMSEVQAQRAGYTQKDACIRISNSQRKGENWKHNRVVTNILSFLGGAGASGLNVQGTTELQGDKEPDIEVKHSSPWLGMDVTYIIVANQNRGQARELYEEWKDKCIFFDMHRWREEDVDLISYIEDRLLSLYHSIGSGNMPDFLRLRTVLPNITEGVPVTWKTKNPRFVPVDQRLAHRKYEDANKREWDHHQIPPIWSREIVFDPRIHDDDRKEKQVVKQFDELVDAARKHNEWALGTPRNEEYHLSNLRFKRYEGNGDLDEPSLDAIYRHMCSSMNFPWAQNLGHKLFHKWGGFSYNFEHVRTKYRTFAWGGGKRRATGSGSTHPYTFLNPRLAGIKLGEVPKLLTDTTGIEETLPELRRSTTEKITRGDYRKLMYAVTAGKELGDTRHPSLISLMEELKDPVRPIN